MISTINDDGSVFRFTGCSHFGAHGNSYRVCGTEGQIENFRLMHHFLYDEFKRRYLLVGCVGEGSDEILKRLDNRNQRPGW